MKHERLTFTQFVERFTPLHFSDARSMDGFMLETYGDDYALVIEALARDPACVWTVVTDDDGALVVSDGWHYVNRHGYIITAVPCPEGTAIDVPDDD